jgi:hypothetical protein
MIYQAQQRRANAIVAFRFDNGEIAGRWTEICAYGTAVWVAPTSDAAKQQYEALVAAGRMPHQQQYATNISEYGPPPSH